MRRLALIAVLALMVVACVWWISRGSPNASEPIAITAHAAEDREQQEVTLLEEPATSTNSARSAPAPVVERDVLGSPIPNGLRRLQGAVLVIDEHGLEHPKENGTLDLDVWNDGQSVLTDVPVVAGQWELDLDRAAQLSVSSGVLGGRKAYDVRARRRSDVPVDGRIDLRLLWSSPLVLHARDAATQLDLSRLAVLATKAWGGFMYAPFVPDRTKDCRSVAVDVASPVTIPAEDLTGPSSSMLLYVRAPGHAWAQVECDPRLGGDVFVDLVPAAAMDVELIGDAGEAQAMVRVYSSETRRMLFETPVAGGSPIAIDDIPAAAYRLTVESSDMAPSRTTFAESEARPAPGARQRVQLRIRPPVRVQPVALSGLLRIPSAWEGQRPFVVATTLDSRGYPTNVTYSADLGAATTVSDGNEYSWSIPAILPGRYQLTTGEPRIAVVVEVPAQGLSDVKIDVPPPGKVSVDLVDAETREPAALDQLAWMYKSSDVPAARAPSRVSRDPNTHKFEFQCPLGDIAISSASGTSGSGYWLAETIVRVVPGENPVTIPVFKMARAELTVMDGERLVPLPGGIGDFEVTELVSGDGPVMWGIKSSVMVVHVRKPGTYRIRLKKPVPGYLMPSEQLVDLKAGTTTDVAIRLTRKP